MNTLMEIKGFLQCIAANKQQACGLAAAASCSMFAACEFLCPPNRRGGHIIFDADPVDVGVCVRVASFPHVIF